MFLCKEKSGGMEKQYMNLSVCLSKMAEKYISDHVEERGTIIDL
jgi:hypothetical protein